MAQAITASMPQHLDLDLACKIIFEAVDPTTGAAVSGVTISNALIRVDSQVGAADGKLSSGAFVLIPGPGG